MDCSKIRQEANKKCELDISNKNISSESIISCLDDNLNYTYAKSCNGGKYFLIVITLKFLLLYF